MLRSLIRSVLLLFLVSATVASLEAQQIDPLAGDMGQICGSLEYLDGPAVLHNIEILESKGYNFSEEYFSQNCGGLTILQTAILEHICGHELNIVKAVMGKLMESGGPEAVYRALEEDVLRGANPDRRFMADWIADLKVKTIDFSEQEWQELEELLSAFREAYPKQMTDE